jgi:hypothetical protein
VADRPVVLPPELIVLCTRIFHNNPGGALPGGARAMAGKADAADLQVPVPYIQVMTDQLHSGAGGPLLVGSGYLAKSNMDLNGCWGHGRCVDGSRINDRFVINLPRLIFRKKIKSLSERIFPIVICNQIAGQIHNFTSCINEILSAIAVSYCSP